VPVSKFIDLDPRVCGRASLAILLFSTGDLRTRMTDALFLVDVLDWAALPTSFQQEIQRNYLVIQSPLPNKSS